MKLSYWRRSWWPHFEADWGEHLRFGYVWAGWWLITWDQHEGWRSLHISFMPD